MGRVLSTRGHSFSRPIPTCTPHGCIRSVLETRDGLKSLTVSALAPLPVLLPAPGNGSGSLYDMMARGRYLVGLAAALTGLSSCGEVGPNCERPDDAGTRLVAGLQGYVLRSSWGEPQVGVYGVETGYFRQCMALESWGGDDDFIRVQHRAHT